MSRSRVERAVARATGESLSTIKRLGFSMIEPAAGNLDDQPSPPNVVDWDALQQQRVGLFPHRRQTAIAA
ncbi:MAG TPA: hypothetical protein VHC19_14015 [Pirellulales bacterium]|nr:hypothetical protein [Pirellulales bacterium]